MKDLDFTFPILRNEEKTREIHMGKCEKTKDLIVRLPRADYLAADTMERNHFEFSQLSFDGQKGVKAIKTRVNQMMREELFHETGRFDLPEIYTTALYLNNFDEINKIMEEASKEIYETLNG